MLFLGLSVCLRFAAFLFALYIGITGLFSNSVQLPNQPAESTKSTTAATNNIILMVIDGFRSDMISSPKYSDNWPMLKKIMQQGIVECSTTTLSYPTVTGPRLKTMATGRLSAFLDAIENTKSSAVTQDSWVQRLFDRRKRLELYGDNTWLKLFPHAFTRADGLSSFFITDFYEVDSSVTRHIDDRIPAVTEWDAMVLHYLGLDHIGHVEGTKGASMAPKLREMDGVVWKVYQHLNASGRQDWLVILTGDHGMNDQGSHGGTSFFEASTTLLLISPKFARVPSESACEIAGDVYRENTDQTDLATIIGLLAGVGIPSGSIGVPPNRTLLAFWPQARERLRVLRQLQQHLHRLLEFVGRNSDQSYLFVPNEVTEVQQVKDEITKLLELCSTPSSSALKACRHLDLQTDEISRRLLSLMHRFQKSILLTASESKLPVVRTYLICMWVITLSFCLPAVFDIFGKKYIVQLELLADSPDLPQQTTGDRTYASMVRMLAVSVLSIIGLHITCLKASSMIEWEELTWYFLSASALSLFLAVMIFADPANDHSRARSTRILSIAFILSADRFALRDINTTNGKWIHLPLLPDWMNEHGDVFVGLLLVFFLRLVLCNPAPLFRWYHARSVASLLLVAVSQLVYRSASSRPSNGNSRLLGWMSPVWSARIAYLCILLDLITSLQMTAALSRECKLLGVDETPVLTSGGNPPVSPVHAFGLLAMLLGRPSGTLLWAGVLLKETLLTRAFHNELAAASRCSAHAQTKMEYFIALLYWIQGWTTFFQAGNSNEFHTIDLSAGYVGLSGHSDPIFLLLAASYTFAGPIFWQLSLFYRFFASRLQRTRGLKWNMSNGLKSRFGSLSLGLLTATTTMSATVCSIHYNHPFIWSVFGPKLFYMAALNVVFVPLLFLVEMF